MIINKNWNHHFFIYRIIFISHHPTKENYVLKEANDEKYHIKRKDVIVKDMGVIQK